MKKKILSSLKKLSWAEILFGLLFIIQTIIILYFNLKLLENHMGSDSSWSYLKAELIWKEKSLNSPNWIDQTNAFLDSSMLIATIIYAITGNLLVSYGAANMIIVVCIILVMWRILVLLGVERKYRLVAYNLIVCPFLTNGFAVSNDLGYFNDLLSGSAFYSVRALIVLMIVYEFIYIKINSKNSSIGILTLLLCAVAGASSGIYIIVVILLPYLVYEMEVVFAEDSISSLKRRESIFGILGCISVAAGKLIAEIILKIPTIDDTRSWTSIERIWTNFVSVIQGFMKLLGVLPVTQAKGPIMSEKGLIYIYPIIIFSVIVLAIGFLIKKLRRDVLQNNGILLFLVNIVLVNILMFSLFNARYGAELFEERYLITTFMVIIVLVAVFLNDTGKTKVFSKAVMIALLLALIGNDYVSDKIYTETTNESWQMQDIISVVNSENADLVYMWGDEVRTLGRVLRVSDLNHIYKEINTKGGYYHGGDYLYYEDNSDYKDATLLIFKKGVDYIPENILSQYTLIKELRNVSIYKCEYNPIDMVSGITGDNAIDYPDSFGMKVKGGKFEGNSFVTDGTSGLVMWGPYYMTKAGIYNFTLHYHLINYTDSDNSYFDVAANNGRIILGKSELDPAKDKITIPYVQLEDGQKLEYRVYCEEGTIIKIDKVEITKK